MIWAISIEISGLCCVNRTKGRAGTFNFLPEGIFEQLVDNPTELAFTEVTFFTSTVLLLVVDSAIAY